MFHGLGLVETFTNMIQIILEPREMDHKYNVFKVVSLGSHQISALGRYHPTVMQFSDPRD